MRPLTEEETRVMFEKMAKYIGENLQLLVDRPDGTYCFRLHNDRVYYVSEKILKLAANISGDKLVSLGTCFGKFTKSHRFRLHITALDYLAPYAKVCGVAPRRPWGGRSPPWGPRRKAGPRAAFRRGRRRCAGRCRQVKGLQGLLRAAGTP
uniref:Nucleolar pre-rRNA processing protein NIP7 n=1 Tax=Canis lupus dingo TaxID=286419 RepID=A0A8C0L3N6_CANLU